MQYRSKLSLDYKQTLPRKAQKQHHYRLITVTAFVVLTIMGAVVANVRLPEEPGMAKPVSESPDMAMETLQLPLKQDNSPSPVSQSDEIVDAIIDKTTTQASVATDEPVSITPHQDTTQTAETVTIRQGDTLSALFSARQLNSELHKIMQLGDQVKALKSVYPGQKLHFYHHDNSLRGIELETSVNRRLSVVKHDTGYTVEDIVREFDVRTKIASSTIDTSLFLAGQRAGLSDAVIMDLANIFGWDIDFALDIRTGDQFSVIYEEKYLDGEKISDGSIIAAEFTNAGESYRAVRYTDSQGNTDYYSEHGRSMRKPFLRTPVDFARISSKFNLKRKHPILNKIRAHRGVDYAASIGTPIKASGDGKIVHRGKKGGYGNTIIVKHGSRYSTLYAHMHKYARNTQVGKRVKQGQIIGYVGKSGLATGPHLHYEFLVNGVHRNPLTVKLPDASPLPESEMKKFRSATAEQFAQLDLHTSTALAQNQR